MVTGDKARLIWIGERIQRFREGAGLTVDELARRAGLLMTQLQRIEEEYLAPPLGILARIAEGLGIKTGHFFGLESRNIYSYSPAGEKTVATRLAIRDGQDFGIEYQYLGLNKRGHLLEPFSVVLSSRQLSVPKQDEWMFSPLHHSGEEIVHVQSGKVEIRLAEQPFMLLPGDVMSFDARIPHQVQPASDGECQLLVILGQQRAL